MKKRTYAVISTSFSTQNRCIEEGNTKMSFWLCKNESTLKGVILLGMHFNSITEYWFTLNKSALEEIQIFSLVFHPFHLKDGHMHQKVRTRYPVRTGNVSLWENSEHLSKLLNCSIRCVMHQIERFFENVKSIALMSLKSKISVLINATLLRSSKFFKP